VGLAYGLIVAQESTTKPDKQVRPGQMRHEGATRPDGPPRPAEFERFRAIINDMNLPPEKRAQVQQIFETFRQSLMNWRRQHQAEIEALREQIRKLEEGPKELRQDLLKQLSDVLTKEQAQKLTEALDQARPGGGRFGEAMAGRLREALNRLELTDEQKTQIKTAFDKAREDFGNAKTPQDREQVQKTLREQIEKILTPQQRQKLAEMRERTSQPASGPGERRERNR